MASYRVEWKRSARKELRKLPPAVISKVVSAVERLIDNPVPSGVRKLLGAQRAYRLRVGDYRVIYTIDGSRAIIEIVRVAHRKDVYRR